MQEFSSTGGSGYNKPIYDNLHWKIRETLDEREEGRIWPLKDTRYETAVLASFEEDHARAEQNI